MPRQIEIPTLGLERYLQERTVQSMHTMKQYTVLKAAQRQGRTVSAIAASLGQDRKTVRKYFRMDKDKFIRYLEKMAERGKTFKGYRDEILDIYNSHEGRIVYASSVFDYLGEKYGELPGTERTLRNYLAYLKASGATGKGRGREYKPVDALPYGKQAQIDFGQEPTSIGKVYFAVIALARSRYRYVAPQAQPFTTLDVIGHLLDAFEYFGGVPEELVLDQDRTMLVAENLGDLSTTRAFTDFIAEQGLKLWVCRAADPESKGKVENAVKFVKTNFFSSRSFDDFEDLAAKLRKWLLRANSRISQATRMMPLADFEAREKPALRQLRASIFRPSAGSGCHEPRKVDQKSLISVSDSKYSVPSAYRLGNVEIDHRDGFVRVYDVKTGLEIAVHAESRAAGAVVADPAHYSDRAAASELVRTELIARLPDDAAWAAFVDGMWTGYRRYFRQQAARLSKLFEVPPDRDTLAQALALCREHGLAHAQDLLNVYTARGGVLGARKRAVPPEGGIAERARRSMPAIQTHSLSGYQSAIDAASRETGGEA